MAHSIEGRVPFLDVSMIRLGQLVPPELKLAGSPATEKWILRKAFEDLLPQEIVWREKEQFDEGSGTVDLLKRLVAEYMTEEEFGRYHTQYPEAKLRSAEECHYHRLFLEAYAHPEAVLENVARWAERPL